MLAKRIIPCLDIKDGRVVKGINFLDLKDAGDPVENAKEYDLQGADELVFLDITASHENRSIIYDVVERVAETVFMPLTVGGGIQSTDDIRKLLISGCDKVSLNTQAVKKPSLVNEAAKRFGSQCIVVAIDAKQKENGTWEVYIHGGRTKTGKDCIAWAKQVQELGAGEILLTSMDRDGTKSGFDLELMKKIQATLTIPVIASGGCGSIEDIYDVLVEGGADAALAASIFHYKEHSVRAVKTYLMEQGVDVRNN